MAEKYVHDLCTQLDDLGSVAGKSACVRTRSGKVQVDDSISGRLWRKLINTEDESRATTVSGIESLLSTVNDYAASMLKMPPIHRNIVINNVKKGKVLNEATSPASPADEHGKEQPSSRSKPRSPSEFAAVERAQEYFFNESNASTIAGLKSLAISLRNSSKGIADLLSRRYCGDYEIVPLLLDLINFSDLIATRIEQVTRVSA